MKPRAVGIVRVSRVRGRSGESFISPGEQRERIVAACERDGMKLIAVHDELDVSGGTALADRPGLRAAVEAVEAGQADVVVAAYFDRLVRSVKVQGELVARVEAAGGRVLAVDVGQVTEASAGQWLSGTMLGAVSEYVRRTTAERAREAQIAAVARGAVPWPNIPPGYIRRDNGVLEIDVSTAPAVVEAFRRRAGGATVDAVRQYLAEEGIERSYNGVCSMLGSRLYLGEIHFKALVNVAAHPPLIDPDTWRRAQAARQSGGRRAKSDRLLARLGVLRCGTCDARMVVGTQTQNGRSYPFYRCPSTGTCEQRMAIGAHLVEDIVSTAVRDALQDLEGRASVERNVREAEAVLERAQQDLDAAVRAFVGLEGETAARERLQELRAARDECQAHVDQLGGEGRVVTIGAAMDWDRLSLETRRALIRLVIARVSIAPGRGPGRISVEFVGE